MWWELLPLSHSERSKDRGKVWDVGVIWGSMGFMWSLDQTWEVNMNNKYNLLEETSPKNYLLFYHVCRALWMPPVDIQYFIFHYIQNFPDISFAHIHFAAWSGIKENWPLCTWWWSTGNLSGHVRITAKQHWTPKEMQQFSFTPLIVNFLKILTQAL